MSSSGRGPPLGSMVLNDESLKGCLARLRAEGVLDSRGSFTLGAERAASKLAEFSLPRPFAWVLKVVQAAVGCGTSMIRVRQDRLCTSFSFNFAQDRERPSELSLLAMLYEGDLLAETALARLCLALRCMMAQKDRPFVLTVRGPDGSPYSIVSDHETCRLTERQRQEWAALDGFQVRLSVGHVHLGRLFTRRLTAWLRQERWDLQILEELEERAFVCPVPINVDGRLINNLQRHPRHGFSTRRRPLVHSPLPRSGVEHPALLVHPSFQKALLPTFPADEGSTGLQEAPIGTGWMLLSTLFGSGTPRPPVGQDLSQPGSWSELRSRLCWVRAGVVIEEQLLPCSTWLCELTLVLNADGIGLDVTGFGVADCRLKEQRRQYAARHLKALVSRLRRETEPRTDKESSKMLRLAKEGHAPRGNPQLVALLTLMAGGVLVGSTLTLPVLTVASIGGAIGGSLCLEKNTEAKHKELSRRRWLEMFKHDLTRLERLAEALDD